MTTTPPTAKHKPDYVAYVPVPSRVTGEPPRLVRAGCAFTYRNGAIGVLYDLVPLSGQLILVGIDDEHPESILFGHPTHAPQFEACHARDTGKETFWTAVGDAYRMDGYLSVLAAAWPRDGKVVLSQPKATN